MRQLSLALIAGIAVWLLQVPAIAADFEPHTYYGADLLSCRELAREEARFIVEIYLLHPLVKHHKHSAAAAHVKVLKGEKQMFHHERRDVECI